MAGLDSGAEDVVAELRNERKTSWPTGPSDRDDARRPNNRRIMGAKHFIADIAGKDGKLAATGVVPLDRGRVNTHWWLWEGEQPAVHSYAKKPGYIAVKYKDELFEISNHKAHFRWFGVADAKVQQNLFIVLEPQLFDPQVAMWGAALEGFEPVCVDFEPVCWRHLQAIKSRQPQ